MPTPRVPFRLAVDGDLRRYFLRKAGVSQEMIAARCGVTRAVVVRILDDTYSKTQRRALATTANVRQAIADAVEQPVKKLWPEPPRNGRKGTRR